MANTPSVNDVLKKVGGKQKQKGGGARKIGTHKKSAAFQRYHNEGRGRAHQIKQIKKHLLSHPEDKQSASRLQSIEDSR